MFTPWLATKRVDITAADSHQLARLQRAWSIIPAGHKQSSIDPKPIYIYTYREREREYSYSVHICI